MSIQCSKLKVKNIWQLRSLIVAHGFNVLTLFNTEVSDSWLKFEGSSWKTLSCTKCRCSMFYILFSFLWLWFLNKNQYIMFKVIDVAIFSSAQVEAFLWSRSSLFWFTMLCHRIFHYVLALKLLFEFFVFVCTTSKVVCFLAFFACFSCIQTRDPQQVKTISPVVGLLTLPTFKLIPFQNYLVWFIILIHTITFYWYSWLNETLP